MSDIREPDVVTVLVSRVDGGVTVLRVITAEYEPDGEGGRRQRWAIDPTPEYIAAIIAKHDWHGGQRAVSWETVSNDIVDATDRYFRNAWKANGKRIEVDMPKAREIHRTRLRVMRTPLLEALDIADLRAAEEGLLSDAPNVNLAKRRAIAAQKQALRDTTDDPRIDAATTPEELKAVIPDALSP